MVAVPTIEEEDAKRPSRERENLVGERTRIINRMKSALPRLGIRGFKPQLRKAPQLVEALRTPEDVPIPPKTLDEIRRDLAHLAILREQIQAIEQARLKRLEDTPQTQPNAMVRVLSNVIGPGIETAFSLAAEANDCFMVRPRMGQSNTRVQREFSRAMAGSPRFVSYPARSRHG
jgi:transposase